MKTYFTGDIHGDFKAIRSIVERNPELKDTPASDNILICLGDFGANFFRNERDEGFKKKISTYPFTYFVIRGNHEERPLNIMKENENDWYFEVFFESLVYIERKYPNIKYALDGGGVYNIPLNNEKLKTLILPGAYSVDKYYRLKNNWSWFPEEQMTEEEMIEIKKLCKLHKNKFDLILSHTCPIQYEPTDLFLSVVDQSMVDKTMERFLGKIERKIEYSYWLWGHYHQDRIYPTGKQIMLFQSILDLDDLIAARPKFK